MTNTSARQSDVARDGRSLAVSVERMRKTFGATLALDDASFAAPAGTVHALLGENGAGKSTIVKLLSGLVRPDHGQVNIFGEPARLDSPRDAHRLGIQTAFQELTLVPDLSVAENYLLPYQPVGFGGQLRGRYADALVADHLRSLGIVDIAPSTEVRTLALPVRQKIEIARAVHRKPRILLLDEPTSALSGSDIDWLGHLIEDLKKASVTVIFISHRMQEVRKYCDGLTILRNGRDVGTFTKDAISDDEVVELIIGRSLDATFPPRPSLPAGVQPVLEVKNLSAGRLESASFEVRPGEIVGVAGLQGMGQLDLFLSLFGDISPRSGSILVNQRPVRMRSPRDAIKKHMGISLVPEERKTEALFLELDARLNTTLPVINRFVSLGLIDISAETQAVAGALNRVNVNQRALYSPVYSFSGGNQQKIVLAKWMLAGSRILLLFDPTRGVDVGTKHEIYLLLSDYVKSGGAILLYSTEIAEIVNLCHRVLVVYGGRIIRSLGTAGDEISEAAIMRAALGDGAASARAAQ